jgi:hypothetical protein
MSDKPSMQRGPEAGTRTTKRDAFVIELVVLRGRSQPEVVETFNSNFTEFTQIPAVEKTAEFLLEKLRRERRATPPDGFRIRAVDGRVVYRFLVDQFTHSPSIPPRLRDAE